MNSNSEVTQEQIEIVKRSISQVEILTPLYKNISRNNAELANGRLERISPKINRMYNFYLEKYQSDIEVGSKFGESLQAMSIQYIYPVVSYQYALNQSIQVDFEKIRGNNNFINTFHRSVWWRKSYLNWLDGRIKNAEELLKLINIELDNHL